jgi:CubicO group peptidase (beta-lactamase class C family)
MNRHGIVRLVCFSLFFTACTCGAVAEGFTNAIRAFLEHHGEFEKRDGGIVVGIVDEHGSSIVSYGKLDNGTEQEVNGDTVFGIYSMTVTFTGLLLEDMIERG